MFLNSLYEKTFLTPREESLRLCRFDNVHVEESQHTTVGSYRLLVYFLRFFRPRRVIIAATLMLAVCATATELTLPQLVRTGIDRYIVPEACRVDMDRLQHHPDLVRELEADLTRIAGTDVVFLGPEALRRAAHALVPRLQSLGVGSSARYYTTAATPGALQVVRDHPDMFFADDHVVLVAQADMARLSPSELLQLRRG